MEHYKICKLLNDSITSKFVTKKCIKVNDLSSGQYFVTKNIFFKTSVLTLDLWDYSKRILLQKGQELLKEILMLKKRNKKLTFKNNDLHRSSISKINNTFLHNAEDNLQFVKL